MPQLLGASEQFQLLGQLNSLFQEDNKRYGNDGLMSGEDIMMVCC
jgi:hypothetical protein